MTRLDDLSPLYWDLCIDHLLYFQHPENTETKCSYVLDQGLTVTRRNLLVNLQFQSTHNQYFFTSLQFITTDVQRQSNLDCFLWEILNRTGGEIWHKHFCFLLKRAIQRIMRHKKTLMRSLQKPDYGAGNDSTSSDDQ